MPLRLDMPFFYNPGGGRPVETATMVMIESVHLHLLESEIILQCVYGNVFGAVWVGLSAPLHQVFIRNEPDTVAWATDADGTQVPVVVAHGTPHFDNLRAECLTTAAGVPVFDEAKAHFYQYLLDRGLYEGTVV